MTVRRLDLRLLEQCDMMAETAARPAKDLDNPAIKLDHHIAQDELVHAHHYACGVCQDLALSRPASGLGGCGRFHSHRAPGTIGLGIWWGDYAVRRQRRVAPLLHRNRRWAPGAVAHRRLR